MLFDRVMFWQGRQYRIQADLDDEAIMQNSTHLSEKN
jgi:hypothetical protein